MYMTGLIPYLQQKYQLTFELNGMFTEEAVSQAAMAEWLLDKGGMYTSDDRDLERMDDLDDDYNLVEPDHSEEVEEMSKHPDQAGQTDADDDTVSMVCTVEARKFKSAGAADDDVSTGMAGSAATMESTKVRVKVLKSQALAKDEQLEKAFARMAQTELLMEKMTEQLLGKEAVDELQQTNADARVAEEAEAAELVEKTESERADGEAQLPAMPALSHTAPAPKSILRVGRSQSNEESKEAGATGGDGDSSSSGGSSSLGSSSDSSSSSSSDDDDDDGSGGDDTGGHESETDSQKEWDRQYFNLHPHDWWDLDMGNAGEEEERDDQSDTLRAHAPTLHDPADDGSNQGTPLSESPLYQRLAADMRRTDAQYWTISDELDAANIEIMAQLDAHNLEVAGSEF